MPPNGYLIMECVFCDKMAESLAKEFREMKQALLEEILVEFKEEYKQVQGGGYEGELAVEACIEIVKKKLALCS